MPVPFPRRSPILALAAVVGALCSPLGACAEETGVHNDSPGNGPVGGGANPSDGGGDAGDGGYSDAGPVDAGPCVGAVNRPLASAVDDCFFAHQLRAAALIDLGCDNATIYLDQIPTCIGSLGGPLNAFNGSCGGQPCASASLPGLVTCALPSPRADGGTTCSILFCDVNGSCGP